MSIKELVKKHLMSGKTITPVEAMHQYGTIRLGAYVHRLRQEGMPIRTKMVRSLNGRPYAEYSLLPKAGVK